MGLLIPYPAPHSSPLFLEDVRTLTLNGNIQEIFLDLHFFVTDSFSALNHVTSRLDSN